MDQVMGQFLEMLLEIGFVQPQLALPPPPPTRRAPAPDTTPSSPSETPTTTPTTTPKPVVQQEGAPAQIPEQRVAPDGAAYTRNEFVSFFGSTREWDLAAPKKETA